MNGQAKTTRQELKLQTLFADQDILLREHIPQRIGIMSKYSILFSAVTKECVPSDMSGLYKTSILAIFKYLKADSTLRNRMK